MVKNKCPPSMAPHERLQTMQPVTPESHITVTYICTASTYRRARNNWTNSRAESFVCLPLLFPVASAPAAVRLSVALVQHAPEHFKSLFD
ncbi:hypothetical protein K469DRAFT_224625 [Zopfia rhizophila CBS 207.26]|uniref:Uncharacterized protein n=1 Tax=Zopfia rhizophila CBS 207.26 TaxID=1314779 RepID=A0A6A6DUU4_9PEZI|nr:hypothetical protein K469DRAFT_224625 [Zopfia rhizophila CBS 207.26]